MIKIKNLSKVYRIPHEKRTTLFENLLHIVRCNFDYERLDALKNINLEVKPGECLGIIGPNGSGKSTLLRILAGIIKPTNGHIRIEGDIVPFLDLSVGFQGDLTAKENIYLYGALRGLTKKEVGRRFDDIITFAGIERFVDTKLKDFSSGMHARLAFSTAIQAQGDIFLIDEVLAVGDMEFQKKCMEAFNRIKKQGKSIVMVTHNLNVIKDFCDSAVLLDKGTVKVQGRPSKVVDSYTEKVNPGYIAVKACIRNKKGIKTKKMRKGEKTVLRFEFRTDRHLHDPHWRYAIRKHNKEYVDIPEIIPLNKEYIEGDPVRIEYGKTMDIEPGIYYVAFQLIEGSGITNISDSIILKEDIVRFEVYE